MTTEPDPLARFRCQCGHLDTAHSSWYGCAATDCGCRRFTRDTGGPR